MGDINRLAGPKIKKKNYLKKKKLSMRFNFWHSYEIMLKCIRWDILNFVKLSTMIPPMVIRKAHKML